MWDEWYCEIIIPRSHDSETYAVECYASLLDDEVAILGVKIYSNKIRVILIMSNLRYGSNCIHVSCDEVPVDTSLSPDTSFDVEHVSDFFISKIGTRKTLLHREKRITLRCDIRQGHTDSIMRDTLTDGEWLIVEVVGYCEVTTSSSDDARCAFDNSGEQKEKY